LQVRIDCSSLFIVHAGDVSCSMHKTEYYKPILVPLPKFHENEFLRIYTSSIWNWSETICFLKQKQPNIQMSSIIFSCELLLAQKKKLWAVTTDKRDQRAVYTFCGGLTRVLYIYGPLFTKAALSLQFPLSFFLQKHR
jgi:hypothetical protein